MDTVVQTSVSNNPRKATLRGLHYQLPPSAEEKLVSCVRGRLFDVIVDLRPRSPTYGQWYGLELSDAEPKAIYMTKGFAHGFLTLTDDTWVLYQISEAYDPDRATGIRWDDPELAIDWPIAPEIISERDRALPSFEPIATFTRNET